MNNSVKSAHPVSSTAMFPARMAALADIRQFLDHFCHAAGVAHSASLRLNLVAEELFTNTVKHGNHGDSDNPVLIALEGDGLMVRILYEDQAPPFNPLAFADRLKLAEHVQGGKVGGLGAVLARELSLTADYSYLFGHNRLKLTLAPK